MNKNTKVVMGTLGAALAGAAAGVLLAPKKGTETRSMIKNKANDLSSNAKQTFDKNYEKSKKTINDLTEKVKNNFRSDGSNGSEGTGFQKNERYVAETAAPMSSTKSYSNPATGTSTPGTTGTATKPGNPSSSDPSKRYGDSI